MVQQDGKPHRHQHQETSQADGAPPARTLAMIPHLHPMSTSRIVARSLVSRRGFGSRLTLTAASVPSKPRPPGVTRPGGRLGRSGPASSKATPRCPSGPEKNRTEREPRAERVNRTAFRSAPEGLVVAAFGRGDVEGLGQGSPKRGHLAPKGTGSFEVG